MSTEQSDILLRLYRGEDSTQAPDDPETEVPQEPLQGGELLMSLVRRGGVTHRRQPEPDLGFVGAVGSGIGTGIREPLTFLTGAQEPDERIDSTAEKVGFVLGEMAGLGISFVPFAAGTGLAMRGVGLASTIARGGPVWNFTRNTIAGALQFGGISEDVEDIPKNVALGAAFGGAIEGVFLGWAMRNRGGAASAAKLFDDGSPVGDVPVSPSQLSMEINLAPSAGQTRGRIEAEVIALAESGGDVPASLAGLARGQESTVFLPEVQDLVGFVSSVRNALPDAQILQRESSVLIHNPAIPEARLTSKQAAQWQSNGVFEGLEGIYQNRTYEFTGIPVAEGRVQLRDPDNPGRVFAPLREEVNVPVVPRVFGQEAETVGLQRITSALRSSRNTIGFALRGEEGTLTRGLVDISEYETVPSVREFIRNNMDTAQQLGVDPSTQEGLAALADARGVRGLLIQDEGFPTEVRVFDQGTVQQTESIPSIFQTADEAMFGPEGELLAFEPSWRNRVIESLRESGVGDERLGEFLELYSRTTQRGLDDLVDEEFAAMRRTQESQFFEGCL